MKRKKLILRLLITCGLFYYIFSSMDLKQVLLGISGLNPRYIPIIILLLILNYIVSSLRWKNLLIFENSEQVSLGFLTKLYFVGSFFNNFMPTSIGGDVYKIVVLGNKIGSKTNAFTATFMERFTGMVSLVLISYLGLVKTNSFWWTFIPQIYQDNKTFVFLYYFVLIFGFWIAAFCGFYTLYFLRNKVTKIGNLYNSFLEYKSNYKVVVLALLTSFIVQLLSVSTQYCIFLALGYSIPIFHALFVFPVITLASFFIPSLNGLGVQDALYIQLLSVVGITSSVALTGSLIYHIMRLAVSLIGGVLYASVKSDS